jgi:hypothetical protein
MNKFTKQQLELLWCACDKYPAAYDLLDKIQSLIDNYCEHSESEANHNYEVEKCKKCGRLFV